MLNVLLDGIFLAVVDVKTQVIWIQFSLGPLVMQEVVYIQYNTNGQIWGPTFIYLFNFMALFTAI